MSRSVPAALLALMLSPTVRWTHRVEIEDTTGAFRDYTVWFERCTWRDHRDAGGAGGTLTLAREAVLNGVSRSLAPLVEASPDNRLPGGDYAPAIHPFRRFRVYSAPYAPGQPVPAWPGVNGLGVPALPWLDVLAGRLDNPSWGGRGDAWLEVPFRDLSAPLQDAPIDARRVYGSAGGTLLEVALQQMAVDHGFTPAAGFPAVRVLGDTEGWSVRPFEPTVGVKVWQAQRDLALQAGFDFRMWRHPDGVRAPTVLVPRRDVDSVDLDLALAQIADIPRLVLNGADVRNDGTAQYLPAGATVPLTVHAEDLASILAFGGDPVGRRKFGIPPQPNIDTAAEAQQLIDAAVADLSTPALEQGSALPYLPVLELGDVLQYPSLAGTAAPLYDTPQRFGTLGFDHTISTTAASTAPEQRGRPVGAYARWFSLIRRSAPLPPTAAPQPPVADAYAVAQTLTSESVVLSARPADAGTTVLTYERQITADGVTGPWSASAPVPPDGITVPEDLARGAEFPVIYRARVTDPRTGAISYATHVVGSVNVAVDTQPVWTPPGGGPFESGGYQLTPTFDAVRLWGTVLEPGDPGQVATAAFTTDDDTGAGATFEPFAAPGFTPPTAVLPVHAAGVVKGPIVKLRASVVGDVRWRVALAARADAGAPPVVLRNVALQWLRGGGMAALPAPPAPLAVAALCVGAPTAAAVNRLTWPAVPDGITVDVLRDGALVATGQTGTTYDDAAVVPGATYRYAVRGVANDIAGLTGAAVEVTTRADCAAGPDPDPDPDPAVPAAFAVEPVCVGTAPRNRVTCTVPATTPAVEIRRDGAVLATVPRPGSGTVTYDDAAVVAGAAHTYAARGVAGGAASALTAAVAVTTRADCPSCPNMLTNPEMVGAVAATGTSGNGLPVAMPYATGWVALMSSGEDANGDPVASTATPGTAASFGIPAPPAEAGGAGARVQRLTGSNAALEQEMATLTAGATYTASVYAYKPDATGAAPRLYVYRGGDGGGSMVVPSHGAWHRLTVTFEAADPADPDASLRNLLRPTLVGGGFGSDVAFLAAPQVVPGASPGAYCVPGGA